MTASAVIYQIIDVEGLGGIVEAYQVVATESDATKEELRTEALADLVEALTEDRFPFSYLTELVGKFLNGEEQYSVLQGSLKAHFVLRYDIEDPKNDEVIKELLTEFAPDLLEAIDITNQINGTPTQDN